MRPQHHPVHLQGQVPEDAAVQRRHDRRQAGQVHDHGQRPGRRLRDGRQAQGGDRLQARQLRQGRARPAVQPPPVRRPGPQPAVVHQGGGADPADVQLVLRRRQARRRDHHRAAAAAGQGHRPEPADRRQRQVRVDAASCSTDGHPQGIDPSHTPTKGTMVNWNNVSAHGFGSADDAWGGNGSVARVSLLNHDLAQHRRQRQVDAGRGRLGDERGRDLERRSASRPCRCWPGCSRAPRPPTPQAAAMLAQLVAWNKSGRQPAGPQRRRQGRQPRRGDHRRRLAEARRRVHEAGDRTAARPSSNSLFGQLRRAPRRPVQRLVSVLRPATSSKLLQIKSAAAVRQQLLRQGQPAQLPEGAVVGAGLRGPDADQAAGHRHAVGLARQLDGARRSISRRSTCSR